MASKKTYAAIDFQGAANITVGGSAGSSGQVLTSGGSGAMTWTAKSSGGVTKVPKYVVWNNTLASDAGVTFSNDICTITHNLGNYYVIVSAIDHSGWFANANEQVDMNALFMVKCPTTSTITLHFHSSAAVGSGDHPNFSVTIMG